MDITLFAQQIAMARERMGAMQQDHEGEPGTFSEVLEELQSTLEELRVAEETLRKQNDELMLASETIEAERRRYEDLFEFAPDGYLATDAMG